MSKTKPPELTTIGWKIATGLCLEDFCKCGLDTAPCDLAIHMAATVMKTLDDERISDYQLEGLSQGDLRTCDGYCQGS